MEIAVYTEENIEDHEALAEYIRAAVARELRPVAGHITGVEAHLGDDNSNKRSGNIKRCVIVAQLDGHVPISVTHHGTTVGAAVEGACDRLNRMIGNDLGLLRDWRPDLDPLVSESV